jgi:carboxyl-terminal processing protease
MWKPARVVASFTVLALLGGGTLLADPSKAIPSTITPAKSIPAKTSSVKSADADTAAHGQLPLDDLRTFVSVFEQIRASYVEEVDDRKLLENAIRGMLSELDPHSAYLDEKDFSDLQSMTSGEFGGLGIEVGMEDGFVKVISPVDDTPASRAGIQSGDLIIKLDDKAVKGMSLDEAVGLMRGKQGQPIKLVILRKGEDKPIEVTIKRDIIKVRSVRQKILEPGYAYVRLAQFQANTGDELRKGIDELKKKGALQGVVLDLRNNPGGLLQSAVEVSDAFLNQGLIVYTKGRMADADLRYNAEDGDILNGAPLVVLINDGSASAAEIVAGALQDHRRAVLIGTDSFGKGSVQTVIPISETKAIKLTTALYYTPSGRSIQAQGIKPDIHVERAKLTATPQEMRAAEADLDKHLANGNSPAVDNKAVDTKKSSKPAGANDKKSSGSDGDDPLKTEADLQEKDNQLHDALNVLKAMHLSKTPDSAAPH